MWIVECPNEEVPCPPDKCVARCYPIIVSEFRMGHIIVLSDGNGGYEDYAELPLLDLKPQMSIDAKFSDVIGSSNEVYNVFDLSSAAVINDIMDVMVNMVEMTQMLLKDEMEKLSLSKAIKKVSELQTKIYSPVFAV